jgi:hypothetical protein
MNLKAVHLLIYAKLWGFILFYRKIDNVEMLIKGGANVNQEDTAGRYDNFIVSKLVTIGAFINRNYGKIF